MQVIFYVFELLMKASKIFPKVEELLKQSILVSHVTFFYKIYILQPKHNNEIMSKIVKQLTL